MDKQPVKLKKKAKLVFLIREGEVDIRINFSIKQIILGLAGILILLGTLSLLIFLVIKHSNNFLEIFGTISISVILPFLLAKLFAGDSTTDAPPPEGEKKKKKPKGK
jgi:hypothetical protein